MNRVISFVLLSIFAVFIGSQITEGVILVPYWKSLSASEFYTYYAAQGPIIGRFYTILTILSVLIPLAIGIYCYLEKSPALKYSAISTAFSILVIAFFYGYFKHTNQEFYAEGFDENQLPLVLKQWGNVHWARVFCELVALIFLMLTYSKLGYKNQQNKNESIKN